MWVFAALAVAAALGTARALHGFAGFSMTVNDAAVPPAGSCTTVGLAAMTEIASSVLGSHCSQAEMAWRCQGERPFRIAVDCGPRHCDHHQLGVIIHPCLFPNGKRRATIRQRR